MEVHPRVNSVLAKRLWNFLRIAFYMMRKGLVSKRKLIMDMNLMMKRGKVLGKKTFGNLIHHHSSSRVPVRGYGLQEYEFSCSNSPNPVFFHVGKRKHHYFPCINAQDEEPEEDMTPPPTAAPAMAVVPVRKIEYPSPEYSFDFRLDGGGDFAPGEKLSPLRSPFSVRVSDFSGIDEAADGGIGAPQVDAAAEEFIRRFYDQLRLQSRTALLQYQETEYQEMLARGC